MALSTFGTITGTITTSTSTYSNGSTYTNNHSTEYYAAYKWSKNGKYCSDIREPEKQVFSGFSISSFSSEEKAWDYFNKRMIDHIEYLIELVKVTADNKVLEKRLIKYNNSEGLRKLKEFQSIVNSI